MNPKVEVGLQALTLSVPCVAAAGSHLPKSVATVSGKGIVGILWLVLHAIHPITRLIMLPVSVL